MACHIEIGSEVLVCHGLRTSARCVELQKRGFTLIELLVVMAIIALLLTVALPRFHGALDKSKDVVLLENLKVLRLGLDQFHADIGRYPDSLEELVERRYLRAIPVDPVIESNQSWVLIPPRDGDRKGVADVKSAAPGKTQSGQSYEAL